MTAAPTFCKPWRPTLVWVALSALALGGCNLVDIEITSPAQGADVVVGEPVTIEVSIAGEEAPEVREVAFYRLVDDADAVLLGRDTRAPYQATWTPSASDLGTVVLQAVATDTDGKNLGLAFSEVTVVAADPVPGQPGPTIVGSVSGLAPAYDIAVDEEGITAVVLTTDGLTVIDVSSKSSPRIRGHLGIEGRTLDISGGFAVVVTSQGDLATIDVRKPANPALVGRLALPQELGLLLGVAIEKDVAYVSTLHGLAVIDMTNPSLPSVLGSVELEGAGSALTAKGGFVLVGGRGVTTVDARSPRAPVVLWTFQGDSTPWQRADSAGDRALLVRRNAIAVMDVSDFGSPKFLVVGIAGGAADIAGVSDTVVLARAVGPWKTLLFYDVPSLDQFDTSPAVLDTPGQGPAVDSAQGYVFAVDSEGSLTVVAVEP